MAFVAHSVFITLCHQQHSAIYPQSSSVPDNDCTKALNSFPMYALLYFTCNIHSPHHQKSFNMTISFMILLNTRYNQNGTGPKLRYNHALKSRMVAAFSF